MQIHGQQVSWPKGKNHKRELSRGVDLTAGGKKKKNTITTEMAAPLLYMCWRCLVGRCTCRGLGFSVGCSVTMLLCRLSVPHHLCVRVVTPC